jgi:hypothetical protein
VELWKGRDDETKVLPNTNAQADLGTTVLNNLTSFELGISTFSCCDFQRFLILLLFRQMDDPVQQRAV